MFSASTVTHLPRVLSDHCPLLVCVNINSNQVVQRPRFRFLNAWTTHQGWKDFVLCHWNYGGSWNGLSGKFYCFSDSLE